MPPKHPEESHQNHDEMPINTPDFLGLEAGSLAQENYNRVMEALEKTGDYPPGL